jgi:hypothetical protein
VKSTYFGRIYVRNISDEGIAKALSSARFMRGYALFPKEKVPPKYPALQGEFFRVALLDLAHGTKCLFLQDFQKTFQLALSISEVLKDRIVLGHRKLPLQDGSTLKAYFGSDCIMKLGEDEDEELMYRMGQSEKERVMDVFSRFFEDKTEISSVDGLIGRLGIARAEMGFQEALGLLGSQIFLFIDKTSRLYLEM